MAILAPLPLGFSGGGSPRMWRRVWLVLLAWLGFSVCAGNAIGQGVSREYQLKAVLLYNLTQFVEWPQAAFATNDSPLVIGILGDDPFGTVLDEAVRDERSNNRRIVARRFSTAEQAQDCHVLFISATQKKNLPAILARLKGRPILTVADAESFVGNGGMVQLAQNPEHKIRLKINLEAVKAAELAMSAKLLRVAEIVRADGD